MNETKVEEIETNLARTFHYYIDMRKLYEEELRKSYVYKKKVEELEEQSQGLEAKFAFLKEQLNNVEQNNA